MYLFQEHSALDYIKYILSCLDLRKCNPSKNSFFWVQEGLENLMSRYLILVPHWKKKCIVTIHLNCVSGKRVLYTGALGHVSAG